MRLSLRFRSGEYGKQDRKIGKVPDIISVFFCGGANVSWPRLLTNEAICRLNAEGNRGGKALRSPYPPGQAVGWYKAGEEAGFIGAIVGAIIVLVVWGLIAPHIERT